MNRTTLVAGLLALAVASQAQIVHDYENLSEGFLGTTFSANGITYRDVNNVAGVGPDGNPFAAGELGDQLIVEDSTFFYSDFPTFGSAVNTLTFGNAFIPGENLSIGALSSVFIDIAGGATAASFDLAFYENGPWGGIEYRLEALSNGQVVASDSFIISGIEGRDNPTFRSMAVSGATFDTLHLFARLNGEYTSPRGMIDNLSVTPVPEPATLTVLSLAAVAALRRRRR